MKTRNVTVALPEDLLRRIQVIAAARNTSISAILRQSLETIAGEEDGYAKARRAMLRDLAKGYDLGSGGNIRWDRDSLHER